MKMPKMLFFYIYLNASMWILTPNLVPFHESVKRSIDLFSILGIFHTNITVGLKIA